jgi:hypothetical protein
MSNYLYLQLSDNWEWEYKHPTPQQPTATEQRVIVIDLYEEETTERDREMQE